VITGDHSFPNGQHYKNFNNDKYAYEENFRVPLIIVSPKSLSFKKSIGSHLDLMPTLLDILGIKYKIKTAGSSFFEGENLDIPLNQPYHGTIMSLVQYPYKYIFSKNLFGYEKYKLNEDPKELNNIISEEINLEKVKKIFKEQKLFDRWLVN
jgi:arylsulfatase A-like enzyme